MWTFICVDVFYIEWYNDVWRLIVMDISFIGSLINRYVKIHLCRCLLYRMMQWCVNVHLNGSLERLDWFTDMWRFLYVVFYIAWLNDLWMFIKMDPLKYWTGSPICEDWFICSSIYPDAMMCECWLIQILSNIDWFTDMWVLIASVVYIKLMQWFVNVN